MKTIRSLAGATVFLCLIAGISYAQTNTGAETMSTTSPKTVTSADGTKIAYWSAGTGPTLIMVTGAFNDHNTGADLAAELSKSFTVVTYDRRGRGASGDNPTYSPSKEVDDLSALVTATGGKVSALGFSSGAPLIMMAAGAGVPFSKLVLVDAPWMLSDARPRPSIELAGRLRSLVEHGKQGEAVELFQRDYVGLPEDMIVKMRNAPFRPALEKIALTTSYDAEIMGDLSVPAGLLPKVSEPVLLLHGEQSPTFMKETADTIAKELAHGSSHAIAGSAHDLTVDVAPLARKFLERAST